MSPNKVLETPAGKLAASLVAFNTVSEFSNAECAGFIADWMQKRGVRVAALEEKIDGVKKVQLLGVAGPSAPGGLLIGAHMDVVPFDGQPGWKSNPLKLTLNGDQLVARGILDMKGFLAHSLAVLDNVNLASLKRPVILAYTCDEEIVCQGSQRFVGAFRRLLGDCPPPAAAWFGEPSEFKTYHAHKGYSRFTLTIRGKGGHSSRPDLGFNAIAFMSEVLRVIHTINMECRARSLPAEVRELFPDFPYESVNPAIIAGGLSHNMIPDSCDLTISYRMLPGTPPDAILRTLQTRIERVLNATSQQRNAYVPEVIFSDMVTAPSMNSPSDGPLPETLLAATGQPLAGGAPYVTDAGHFAPLGFPCYVCGPGYLNQAHQPNESLPVEHFLKTRDVLTSVIQNFCG